MTKLTRKRAQPAKRRETAQQIIDGDNVETRDHNTDALLRAWADLLALRMKASEESETPDESVP